MIIVVFNKKGGVGKSTYASLLFCRESESICLVEVDRFNHSQADFKEQYLHVEQIKASELFKLDVLRHEYDTIIVDIGIAEMADVSHAFYESLWGEFIDAIVIPVAPGTDDQKLSIESYQEMSKIVPRDRILFGFNKYDQRENTNDEFSLFVELARVNKIPLKRERFFFTPYLKMISELKEDKMLLSDLEKMEHLDDVITEYKETNRDKALIAAQYQIMRRTAIHYLDRWVTPASEKIVKVASGNKNNKQ